MDSLEAQRAALAAGEVSSRALVEAALARARGAGARLNLVVGLRAEAALADSDENEVADATRALADARTRMLEALEAASRRYPWAKPWSVEPR